MTEYSTEENGKNVDNEEPEVFLITNLPLFNNSENRTLAQDQNKRKEEEAKLFLYSTTGRNL